MASPESIPDCPAPWTLKATAYSFMFYQSESEAGKIPSSFLYSPLEAGSNFAKQKSLGGLASVQLIRYSDTPVGPYDELLFIPGKFATEENAPQKTGLKVSRIYVSQKHTCYNGRKNWNIPKHLARFSITDHADGSTTIDVYPHDSSVTEATASKTPFFHATYRPIPYLPYFPMSTNHMKFVGIDLSLIQPPLPKGNGSQGELPGTDKWCKVIPGMHSKKTSLGWWDLKQPGKAPTESDPLLSSDVVNTAEEETTAETYENWWPGFGRWKIGVKQEDTLIEFGEGEYWE